MAMRVVKHRRGYEFLEVVLYDQRWLKWLGKAKGICLHNISVRP